MPGSSSSAVRHWDAILVLVLFFVSNFFIIFPLSLPVPQCITKRLVKALVAVRVLSDTYEPHSWHLRFNFITVPLVSVLVLLACRAIDSVVLRHGIVGANGVEPLSIMALFISLAYISISLDLTGLFRYSAFWVARKGGSSGRLLHLYLFVFFLACGILVGNDPVVLFGTPFLAYFTRISRISPPTAWIFAQFTAANMASVVLVSANLTNLVLAGAYSLSFIKYTVHVILPFLAGAISVYPVFKLLFRSPILIPPSLDLDLDEQETQSHALTDRKGAIFGSILLLVTLAVLIGTSTIGVAVWQVTVPPAVIMLARDTYHDWSHTRKRRSVVDTDDIPHEMSLVHIAHIPVSSEATTIEMDAVAPEPKSEKGSKGGFSTEISGTPRDIPSIDTVLAQSLSLQDQMHRLVRAMEARFPTVMTIARRLPVPLLPFSFLMFILVQGLSTKGWVEVWVGWWNVWVERTGPVGAIGGMGFISCVLCNICGTNIGATIMLARVLQVWTANHSIDKRASEGAIYALALGSNYGAFTLTFSASLAGLLWKQILTQKDIHVHPRQFLLLNLPVSFVAMLCSSAVLVGQVYIIDK